MKCPKCGGDTKVIDGRRHSIYKSYIRKRECIKCGYRFITSEKYIRDVYKRYRKEDLKSDIDIEEESVDPFNTR